MTTELPLVATNVFRRVVLSLAWGVSLGMGVCREEVLEVLFPEEFREFRFSLWGLVLCIQWMLICFIGDLETHTEQCLVGFPLAWTSVQSRSGRP